MAHHKLPGGCHFGEEFHSEKKKKQDPFDKESFADLNLQNPRHSLIQFYVRVKLITKKTENKRTEFAYFTLSKRTSVLRGSRVSFFRVIEILLCEFVNEKHFATCYSHWIKPRRFWVDLPNKV